MFITVKRLFIFPWSGREDSWAPGQLDYDAEHLCDVGGGDGGYDGEEYCD